MSMRTITINGVDVCLSELSECFTHGGKFHADDVCTVALLEFFGFKGAVNRVFKIADELKTGTNLVFDIGNGEFDHHDKDAAEYYEDGCPMAAFGKVARAIKVDGRSIEDLFPGFTDTIAKPIEAHDNGYSSESIAQSYFAVICNSFVPTWDELDRTMDTAFREAVDACREILRRQLIQLRSKANAEMEVRQAEQEAIDGVIILDKFLPWGDFISDNIKGAIFPSARGGWNLQVAPDRSKPGVLANKAKFNFTEEQKALTTFIHAAGFICATNTKEDAIKLIPGVEFI